MRIAIPIAVAALLAAGCAAAPEPPAEKKPACAPPPSELVIKDLRVGTGPEVRYRTAGNFRYTGWLYDGCAADLKGKQFDTNVGKPVPFPLMVGTGRVIKGWDEGLIGLKAGGKRLLVIPPNKGYGARSFPDGRIPPNSTLVFEVELENIIAQPQ